MTTDIERAAFEEWVVGRLENVFPTTFLRRPTGEYFSAFIELRWEGWQARASRPVVVTDEMALQGAWAPINEFAQSVGLQPFDPRMAPDINEIEFARLILSAALNMATNGAPKEKAGS